MKKHQLDQIQMIIRASAGIRFVFLLEDTWYVVGDNSIRESSLSEVTETIEEFPELPVKAFLLHPVWNTLLKRFNEGSFRDSLPDEIQQAKGLEVILCDDRDKANEFMRMKRDNEYTGYFQTVELRSGVTPSVSYI
jgi:hypothetical protein